MSEQLSPLDTMFLHLEQADEGATMHFGAALVFDTLPGGGTPDVERVREHVDRRLYLLPRYRMQLAQARPSRLSWPTWTPAPRFDIAAHVGHATLPPPGGDGELHDWLGDFFSHRLDRRRPLWEMALLDGLIGGRWALVSKTHHCLVDGVGSVDVGRILLDSEPSPPRRRPPGHWSIAKPDGDRRRLSRMYPELLIRGVRAGAGALLHPIDTLARAAAVADLVVHEELIAAPDCSINGPLSATRSYRAVHFALDDLRAIEHALGGTVNDVVLAMSAGGLRRLLLARGETPPAKGLRAEIPVNMRTSKHQHTLGNVVTSLFVELPVAEPDPLARYRRVVGQTESLKTSSQAQGGQALVDLAGLAPPAIGERLGRAMFGSQRVFNLTITNVHGPATSLYALGAPLREVLPYVPLFAGRSIGIAVVSYAGSLVFGLSADRTSTPDLAVLANGIKTAFSELRSTSGPRPGKRAPTAAGVNA